MKKLRVVILISPSKYGNDGYVERFRWRVVPNGTLPHMSSLTPSAVYGVLIETVSVDEISQSNLTYLDLLKKSGTPTLLALIGVQSNQFHRALDLAVCKSKWWSTASLVGLTL